MCACIRGHRSFSFLGWSGLPLQERGVWGVRENTDKGRRDGELVKLLAASPGTQAVCVCFRPQNIHHCACECVPENARDDYPAGTPERSLGLEDKLKRVVRSGATRHCCFEENASSNSFPESLNIIRVF